jgi:dihydroorotate dehydrogenase electron transfer subunit
MPHLTQVKQINYTGLPQALRIVEIRDENRITKTFTLRGALNATPGQFVMVWLPGFDEKPFSLAQTNPIRLTIAAVGPFSRTVHELQVGDLLWVRGPLGRGFNLPPTADPPQKLLLVGGGYGVAPLLFLTQQALDKNHHIAMIIGAKNETGLLLIEPFQELEVPLWLTTEDGSAGLRGRVTDVMHQIFAESQTPNLVCACGPTAMLHAIAALCKPEAIPVQLAWEAHMRCGIGLCGSCEVGQGWLTCLDGPVFEVDPVATAPEVSSQISVGRFFSAY